VPRCTGCLPPIAPDTQETALNIYGLLPRQSQFGSRDRLAKHRPARDEYELQVAGMIQRGELKRGPKQLAEVVLVANRRHAGQPDPERDGHVISPRPPKAVRHEVVVRLRRHQDLILPKTANLISDFLYDIRSGTQRSSRPLKLEGLRDSGARIRLKLSAETRRHAIEPRIPTESPTRPTLPEGFHGLEQSVCHSPLRNTHRPDDSVRIRIATPDIIRFNRNGR
jgi:hypothetical protein